jgi:hypothetical protein
MKRNSRFGKRATLNDENLPNSGGNTEDDEDFAQLLREQQAFIESGKVASAKVKKVGPVTNKSGGDREIY